MNKYSTKYVGMDVHKETIAVAIAKEGRGDPAYYGEIPNTDVAISSRGVDAGVGSRQTTGSDKRPHPCPRRYEVYGRACQTEACSISHTAWEKIFWEV